MRWNVHGTDAATGQEVVLALDGAEAASAVQAAIDKKIVVSHVTRAAGETWRRRLLPLACAGVVVAGALAVALYAQNLSIRAKLGQAVDGQNDMARSVAQVENVSNQRQANAPAVEQLTQQLNAAKDSLAKNQQQLVALNGQLNAAQSNAAQLTSLQARIKELDQSLAAAQAGSGSSQATITRLQQEITLARRRQQELESATATPSADAARVAALEKSNRDLGQQVDFLQQKLLANALKAAATPAPAPADPEPAPAVAVAPARWAIRTSYGAASEFLAMHFEKETFGMTAVGDGMVASFAARPASAASFRFEHDRNHERIFAATLAVAISSDTPRDRATDNLALVSDFLKVFAPSMTNASTAIPAAAQQLAGKDSSQRLVMMGTDYKLTIWNGQDGLCTLKIESPRGDAGE